MPRLSVESVRKFGAFRREVLEFNGRVGAALVGSGFLEPFELPVASNNATGAFAVLTQHLGYTDGGNPEEEVESARSRWRLGRAL